MTLLGPVGPESSSPNASFVPAVDVYEDAETLVLKLEIPGVKAKDLDIKVENQSLVIKGRAQIRVQREGGEFPPDRAAVRQLCAELYFAADGR